MLRYFFGCLISLVAWARAIFFAGLTALLVCLTALPSWAAITYVGAQAAGIAGTTSAQTITFALTGGSDAAPAIGDLVVVTWCVTGAADHSLLIRNSSATNYTLVGSELYANDVYDTDMRVAYRVMPDPVETDVVLSETPTGGTASALNAGSYHIFVLRGVHATPLEQAAQQGTGLNTSLVDPGDMTPTTAGTFIYVSGCGALANGGSYTQADLTDFRAASGVDNNDSNVGAGYLAWTSGTYSPATFAAGGSDAVDNSHAWTIVAFAPAASSTCRGAVMLMGVGGC